MAGELRIEEWDGVVIRAIEHRRQYAVAKVFKGKTTVQFEASLQGNLQPVKDWLVEDQKASEKAAARDTGIDALSASISEYNASIEGEFGKNSAAYKTRPRLARRIEAWEAVVIRAIEHRRQYAADLVFKEQTTVQWEASLNSSLQAIKDWIEAEQKANEKAGARDTGINGLRTEITEYNSSIKGEFGVRSEAFKKRVRVNRPQASSDSSTDATTVDPSK